MPRGHVIVPDETSVLCEGCGYTLDGLPTSGQCPECGLDLAQSVTDDRRRPPAWEDPADPRGPILRFLLTSAAVTLRPKRFYRTLATRRPNRAALTFAIVHWAVSAILLAGTLSIHVRWYERYLAGPRFAGGPWALWAASVPATFGFLWGTTWLAARLTAWEAAYRGLRLPLRVVLRGLYYHAAHFVPVAALAFATVAGNWALVRRGVLGESSATRYLYVLCIEVLAGAGYLFVTYWTGMKNTMYANR